MEEVAAGVAGEAALGKDGEPAPEIVRFLGVQPVVASAEPITRLPPPPPPGVNAPTTSTELLVPASKVRVGILAISSWPVPTLILPR